MRLVSYGPPRAEQPGVLADGAVFPLTPVLRSLGIREGDMNAVLGLLPYARDLFEAATGGPDGVPVETVRLGPPVPRPTNIVGLGLTYAGKSAPPEPVFFGKPTTALIGLDDAIVHPAETRMLAYEVELVIVIGREGRHIARDDASAHIAGFTVGNDVTMPDVILGDAVEDPGSLHPLRAQLYRGKAYDTCLPLGPWIVTADTIERVEDLDLAIDVNGQPRQRASVGDMVVGVPEIVAMVSSFMTLAPGDLVLTGSPPGGAGSSESAPYLQRGDMVTASISGIGALRNPVR
jgi:2,4-diketo-3-deoxy-L-fuconate hydrolase